MSDRNLKYCHHCGTQAEKPDQKFCTNCGAKLPETDYSSSYGTHETDNPFGSAFDSVDNNARTTEPRPAAQKIGWFIPVLCFLLILSAINSVVMGYRYIAGTYTTVETNGLTVAIISADQIYAEYGTTHRIADIIFGIGTIFVSILAVFTHLNLKQLRKNAPKATIVYYVTSSALQILYFIATTMITGYSRTIEIVSIIISTLIWILIIRSYFKKREYLFVN